MNLFRKYRKKRIERKIAELQKYNSLIRVFLYTDGQINDLAMSVAIGNVRLKLTKLYLKKAQLEK